MAPAFQIKKYEKLETEEEREARSREIFDSYIMKELLACSHVSALGSSSLGLLGGRGDELMATSVPSSPSPRVPLSTSRATWRRGRCLQISSRWVLGLVPTGPILPGQSPPWTIKS